MQKIAVIGAGMAGLSLARLLHGKAEISVFDKARSVGGRMSTRYFDRFEFDFGAQYFTIRNQRFREFMLPWIENGVVKEWTPRVLTLKQGSKPYKRDWFEPHYVPTPRMTSLCKALAEDVGVSLRSEVTALESVADGWVLTFADGRSSDSFDWVISAAPAIQTVNLFPATFSHMLRLRQVKMQPCLSLMVGYDALLDLNFNAAKVQHDVLDWLCLGFDRPGRPGSCSLLLQTTAQWAEEMLNEPQPKIIDVMLQALADVLGMSLPDPEFLSLHRWRYARAASQEDPDTWVDPALKLAACGDWTIDSRVEAAFLSAAMLSDALEQQFR